MKPGFGRAGTKAGEIEESPRVREGGLSVRDRMLTPVLFIRLFK
jgi:hypothetical protein